MKADGGKFEWGTTITKAYRHWKTRNSLMKVSVLMDWFTASLCRHMLRMQTSHSCVDFSGKMLFSGDDIMKNKRA